MRRGSLRRSDNVDDRIGADGSGGRFAGGDLARCDTFAAREP